MILNSIEREFLSRLSFEPWKSPPVFDHQLVDRLVANHYVKAEPQGGGRYYEITDLGRAAIGRLMQPKLAEAAGLGLLKIVEKPRRDVAASCVRSVKAPLEKEGVRFIGKKMAAAVAFDCLAEVLRADREILSLHAAASPRCPIGPSNRQDCIRVRGTTGWIPRKPPKNLLNS
jgi:DNA-binding PadR family transcriptional regulator